MKKAQDHWFEITLAVVIIVIHVYAACSDAYNFPNSWFGRDDAYYYFKVAQNISEGYGSTFDGINQTNGYHPLWLLVSIPIFALARYDLILPLRVLLLVMAVIQAGTSVLIYRLVSRSLAPSIGMLAASFWAFNFYIHYTVYEQGLETGLAVFTVVYLIYLLSKFDWDWRASRVTPRQIAFMSGVAVLVLFSRLDLIFFVLLVGLWIIFRGIPARFLLTLDLLVIFISMISSYVLRAGFPGYYQYSSLAIISALLSILIKVPIFYLWGLYLQPRSVSLKRLLCIILLAVISSEVLLGIVLIGMDATNLINGVSFSVLLVDGALGLGVILLTRLAAYWFSSRKGVQGKGVHQMELLRQKWKTWITEGAIYYGILGFSLTVYTIWNKLAFGVFSPVSGQIKHWWGFQFDTIYDGPPRNWLSFAGINVKTALNAWQPASEFFRWIAQYLYKLIPGSNTMDERYYLTLVLAVFIVLILLVLNPRRSLRSFTKLGIVPLATASLFHILYYTSTGYAGYKEWYWVGQLILIVLGASLVLDLIIRPVQRIQPGRIILLTSSGILSLYLAFALATVVVAKMPYGYFQPNRPFMEMLPFLELNTPPGSIIGMTGGGNVGYFIHGRTIVNMDGLINSTEYFRALQNGQAAPYLKQKGTDVIFANPGLLKLAPYNGQFSAYLQSYTGFGGKDLMYLLPEPKY